MKFIYLSDYFFVLVPAILIAATCTAVGSTWINHLYSKAPAELLSFPEGITSRAIYRKPLLFLLLAACIVKVSIITTPPTFFYWIAAIVLLSFVTVTDFEQYVIFDAMLLPLAVAGIVYTLHMGLPVKEQLLASLGGGGLFLLLSVLSRGAIGGGDIKLVAVLGLWLGWKSLLSVILYGAIAGGIAALFLLLAKKIKRKQYLAYGPYFALSAIGVLLKLLRVLF